jgi:hypothetical protein
MLQRFSICAAFVLAGTLSVAAVSHARDRGQYTQVSRDIKAWIERLTDRDGTSCCETADGVRPKEVEWDISGNHYRVKVDGKWLIVPDSAVIKGPNRLGHAVVWLYYNYELEADESESTQIRCFLPGPGS